MTIWVDAQLSPHIARWMTDTFGVTAIAVRDIGLRDARDLEIFNAARQAAAVVMTKDGDFLRLLDQFGPPPQVIWITCGNSSNERLKAILSVKFSQVHTLLLAGEPLVEISGPWR